MDLTSIRKEYTRNGLKRCDVPDDPFILFEQWMKEALDAGVTEPTAMVAGTASADGKPSTRTALLKGTEAGRFTFYTNYESRKGQQLAGNPHISLTFPWYQLERQIHVEGTAEKLPATVSDAYFRSRPRNSQIGAIVSPQSRIIGSRMELIRQFIRKQTDLAGTEPQRPGNWGGYAVTPIRIEFWQGRENRLHDRIVYEKGTDGTWKINRLAP